MKLYAANDNNIDLLNLQDEDGKYITDAVLSCAVTDAVTGTVMGTVTLTYLGSAVAVGSYADGNYRGVLLASANLVAGTAYKLAYTSSNYTGLAVNVYLKAEERKG